ncbi:glycoside hydrolase family 3 C-terminal domain-containing protein [Roseburia rectibacter]|uniref:glycoside hydrolase family 3 protein n=1 Tax=Roseburia rectibacter TaxID=2763062 RepID=UPI00164AAE8C|nr:glycoside hydrolase family 3 protein [Roseburia rectibacter]UMZ00131.1 glycoside hydrolase family 3 C-terminal domain-containing protein [Roseburia rectibacter]
MGNSGIGVPLPELAAYCREAAAEGVVLLKNEGHMLPIKKDETVSIFGRSQIEYYRSGTGSGGAVNVPYVKNILDGIKENNAFPVNEELVETYKEWLKEHPFDNGGGGWAAEPWHQEEMEITDEIARCAAEKSEKAIFLIGRTAGEDKDYEDTEGSYLLTKREKENLRIVTKYFNEVAVLLNVSNIIDMSWTKDAAYQDHIKAILYIWQGGMEGANAVADLLSGRVTPSGKLTDTIAEKLSDYPVADHFGSKTENIYAEDIYVGYRYFETFAPEKVMYEFGFGLSYTEFSMETVKAESTGNGKDAKIALSIRVKNTGSAAGKEAAQVYVSAPQGQLGKPAKVLCGFAKTKLLAPGEEEVLELTIPVSRFASYDDSGVTGHKSCYVLEEGLYEIYVGNSVRCTEKANVDGKGGYEIASCVVTEELKEALAPTKEFLRLKTGRQKEDGVFARAYEKAPQQMVDLAERIKSRLPKELPQTGNKGITLQAVAENIKNGSSVEEELDAFVAQFTNEELAVIVRGEGMSSPKVTPGTASAFGGVSDSLHGYGIPIACASDGPSGIRMESGLKATQLPIGTLLACSFNIPMMEELYQMEGRELVGNEIDTLLGPGINIHRYPLNGRNFEYFSEDPLVTGQFAAAMTRGIRSAGSSATVKHFAANNQETERHNVNSVVSERALREIYLKGFEIAVKEGNANSIMTSYNPVNGHWTASNYDLNTTILRGEWGYQGIVMTDWWAKMNDVVNGGEADRRYTSFMVRAQNDLYMVVNNNGAAINAAGDDTVEALEAGKLTVGELQRCAKNICRFLLGTPVMKRPLKDFDPLLTVTAKEAVNTDEKQVCALQSGNRIEAGKFENTVLYVEKESILNVNAHFCFPVEGLAQGAANLYLNGELMATVQTGGTGERFLTQRMCRVKFMPGYYELKAEYVTPELKLDWIELE